MWCVYICVVCDVGACGCVFVLYVMCMCVVCVCMCMRVYVLTGVEGGDVLHSGGGHMYSFKGTIILVLIDQCVLAQ